MVDEKLAVPAAVDGAEQTAHSMMRRRCLQRLEEDALALVPGWAVVASHGVHPRQEV